MFPRLLVALVVSTVLLGCTQEAPPPEPAPPALEDLSQWRVPTLVQPARHMPLPTSVPPPKPTAAERVYEFQPGGTYRIPVALNFPVDIILEPGEERRSVVGGDAEPVEGQQGSGWEVREGKSGRDATMQEHVFVRATKPGLKMGLVVSTTRRVYYLTMESVNVSPVRAVRWTYKDAPPEVAPPQEASLLPDPAEPRQYHVGFAITSAREPFPHWTPRQVVDDGEKTYLIYKEVTLFETVPLVRALTPQGPSLINSRQVLNVVVIDLLASKLELRVGTGPFAEIVTITRGSLRTIQCGTPQDADAACPVWPAAAQALARRP